MGQELIVPDSFKQMGRPAQAFSALNAADDNLSEGIGQSYGIIGYKGKVWSLRVRGQRHNIIRPDDGTPSSYIDVIILGQAKQKSKSYYKAFDQGSEGERPLCSSIDGVTPDPDVPEPQCTNCALCPRNEWKVQANGRKGRECTDYKRLAVLILPNQTKPLFGAPLLEPVFLRVPPASLNSLAILGDTMSGQGFHFSTYVTRISFDPNEAHPKMVFQPLQGLTDGEAKPILALRADPTVGRIITGDVVMKQPAAPVAPVALAAPGTTATGLAPTTTAASAAPTQIASAAAASAPPATNSGLDALTPAQPLPASTLDTTATSLSTGEATSTGLGLEALSGGATTAGQDAAAPQPTALSPAPVQQTTADTGAPEESDEDLDTQIAGLISKQ